MKKEIAVAAAALVFAALAAQAQQGGSQPPAPQQQHGNQEGSKGLRPPPPNPEQMAAAMMAEFDADKDGKLSVTELTAALSAHHQHPPRSHHSMTNAPQHAAGQTGNQTQGEKRPSLPPPETVAARMIERFAADKTALTLPELQQALAAHRPPQGGPGDRHGGAQGNRQGPPQGAPQQGGPAGQ